MCPPSPSLYKVTLPQHKHTTAETHKAYTWALIIVSRVLCCVLVNACISRVCDRYDEHQSEIHMSCLACLDHISNPIKHPTAEANENKTFISRSICGGRHEHNRKDQVRKARPNKTNNDANSPSASRCCSPPGHSGLLFSSLTPYYSRLTHASYYNKVEIFHNDSIANKVE